MHKIYRQNTFVSLVSFLTKSFLTNIQSSCLTRFLIAGSNCFFLIFTIILRIYFDTIFIHKKRFRGALPRYCSGNDNFFDILFEEANKFSSGTSDFFLFTYTQLFCKITGTSRVKYFSSYHTVFSIMQVLRSNFVRQYYEVLGVCAEILLVNKLVLHINMYFLLLLPT